jgi:helix-turn-helix protein
METPMSDQETFYQIQEQLPDHHYRTEIPNIVFEKLDPEEFSVYCHIKKIAGDRGKCWMSMKNLATFCRCGVTTLRKSLNNMSLSGGYFPFPLIKVTERNKPDGSKDTNLIEIIDIWRENGDYFRNQKKIKGTSPNEGGVVRGARGGTSPNEHKEDLSQEDLSKEDLAIYLPSCDPVLAKEERKEALKKEIEFSNGRFQGISEDQFDSWKRAYPIMNIEACIAQFESVLILNPKSKQSKVSWGVRINSWIVKQSQSKEKLKEEVTQRTPALVEEKPKSQRKENTEISPFYSALARNFIDKWSEKLGMKGVLSFCSSIFSVKIHSSNKSWNVPVTENEFPRFLVMLENLLEKELQVVET